MARKIYGINHVTEPRLELTTMVGCPLMCTFCPQKLLKKSYSKQKKFLSCDDLEKTLSTLPKNTRIDFSGMAEPWANPECTDLLELCLKRGFSVAIFTTLYGMTKSDVDRIVDLAKKYSDQFKILCIHLPDASGNMKGWRYNEDWVYAYLSLSNLNLTPKPYSMTMDKNGLPHPSIQHLISKTKNFVGITRANNLEGEVIKDQPIIPSPRHEGRITCGATPFYDHNAMMPNGDIILCCMDYGMKHKLGNLLTQKYEDLFKSDQLRIIRLANESIGFSQKTLCRSCERAIPLALKKGSLKAVTQSKVIKILKYLIPTLIRPFAKKIYRTFQTILHNNMR